eukprot:CAMPEP_0170356098 /NCGR_PEP_ID=MMETSP0117_2-20130122/993_1 /TAXON_ID=400756 /ORGANISM="Durinskia baltica, Strain CSIRO CS-38" /LENGTH=322 /DNA_ID=CAMNT_0010610177 /DNA_START=312 /DNA_END=1280 /DNA_ORIENTATION=-
MAAGKGKSICIRNIEIESVSVLKMEYSAGLSRHKGEPAISPGMLPPYVDSELHSGVVSSDGFDNRSKGSSKVWRSLFTDVATVPSVSVSMKLARAETIRVREGAMGPARSKAIPNRASPSAVTLSKCLRAKSPVGCHEGLEPRRDVAMIPGGVRDQAAPRGNALEADVPARPALPLEGLLRKHAAAAKLLAAVRKCAIAPGALPGLHHQRTKLCLPQVRQWPHLLLSMGELASRAPVAHPEKVELAHFCLTELRQALGLLLFLGLEHLCALAIHGGLLPRKRHVNTMNGTRTGKNSRAAQHTMRRAVRADGAKKAGENALDF